MTNGYHLKRAFTGKEWLENISVFFDKSGSIVDVVSDEENKDKLRVIKGPVVPGMANLHSHAFQYAMAGLTEVRKNPVDTFWSWREMMYFFALRLSPEDQFRVAAKLYLECLKRGYTSVGEFHYIHNSPDGAPYDAIEEMSLAILNAAKNTGIQLTHLPVFYAHSDFGAEKPNDGQRRFINSIDSYAKMLQNLKNPCAGQGAILGIAPHSLRAVSEDELAELIQLRADLEDNAPIHIHIAEQVLEVEAALAYCGKRPVEQLFDLADVNQSWCLIHTTHMTSAETKMVSGSKATVGLCPLTEANLGDGVFNAIEFLSNNGRFGIGSDSNVCCDPFSELQMFEYSQRLTHRLRTVVASDEVQNTGTSLYAKAAEDGARAIGRRAGKIAVGYSADFVELSEDNGTMYDSLPMNSILDYRVFAQDTRAVGDVVCRGKLVVDGGIHPMENKINRDFEITMRSLCQEI